MSRVFIWSFKVYTNQIQIQISINESLIQMEEIMQLINKLYKLILRLKYLLIIKKIISLNYFL